MNKYPCLIRRNSYMVLHKKYSIKAIWKGNTSILGNNLVSFKHHEWIIILIIYRITLFSLLASLLPLVVNKPYDCEVRLLLINYNLQLLIG